MAKAALLLVVIALLLCGLARSAPPSPKLRVRQFQAAVNPTTIDTEADSVWAESFFPLDVGTSALVLMDVWAHHPNDGWLARAAAHRQAKIIPLLQEARSGGLLVIHVPNGEEISSDCAPAEGEMVINNGVELNAVLRERGIKTLLYAGYTSNWCLLWRTKTGAIQMASLGYEVVLLRDCTLGFETPKTLSGEWANRVAINMFEAQLGPSTTLPDLRDFLRR